jgi:hypothetical protein
MRDLNDALEIQQEPDQEQAQQEPQLQIGGLASRKPDLPKSCRLPADATRSAFKAWAENISYYMSGEVGIYVEELLPWCLAGKELRLANKIIQEDAEKKIDTSDKFLQKLEEMIFGVLTNSDMKKELDNITWDGLTNPMQYIDNMENTMKLISGLTRADWAEYLVGGCRNLDCHASLKHRLHRAMLKHKNDPERIYSITKEEIEALRQCRPKTKLLEENSGTKMLLEELHMLRQEVKSLKEKPATEKMQVNNLEAEATTQATSCLQY